MQKLKIIKISDGIFKHVLIDENGIEHIFFNANETNVNIDFGIFSISSAGQNRRFTIEKIELFDALVAIPVLTLEELIIALVAMNYSPLLGASGGGSGTSTTIIGKEFISPVALFAHTTASGDHIYQLGKTAHKIDLINDVAVSSDGVTFSNVGAIWTIDVSGNLIITTSTPLTGFLRITGK
jgi:hypothetical protein